MAISMDIHSLLRTKKINCSNIEFFLYFGLIFIFIYLKFLDYKKNEMLYKLAFGICICFDYNKTRSINLRNTIIIHQMLTLYGCIVLNRNVPLLNISSAV